ncbi:hypothetical protein [Stenotrophomonas sp. Marseille-Q4652]|uniref:hypothetical protein n=1 Tax=Stenotrophomonas sp. Marseille-Q4652 TaxID=2866595 RepID=UPI001CE49C02|nr:hypothetical protein [Stenotrophomonas sp. Marseille-Q4652]
MNAISSISLSGMRVAMQGMHAAAHNIATLPVEPVRRQQVQASEAAGGGVTAAFSTLDEPGQDAWVRDLLTAKLAVTTFTANARLVTTCDDMLGSLFDARA